MLIAFFIVFILLIIINVGVHHNTQMHKCYSISCAHNKNKSCNLKQMYVYDNMVNGLCLNHTQDMTKRFDKIIDECKKRGMFLNLSESEQRVLADIKAIKDVEGFKDFLKKHGV